MGWMEKARNRSVLFLLVGEFPAFDIRDVPADGLAHVLVQVHVPPQKARVEFMGHPQKVVDDQDLPVGALSGYAGSAKEAAGRPTLVGHAVNFLPLYLDAHITNRMPVLHDVWLYIHTNVIIFSYALIGMAAITALLYLRYRAGGGNAEVAKAGGAGSLILAGTAAKGRSSFLRDDPMTAGMVLDASQTARAEYDSGSSLAAKLLEERLG